VPSDLAGRLRAQGMRMTPQRQRVLDAISDLEHATPERIAEQVLADGGPALAASTVYRTLEALEALGIVSHTHLDHGAPAYHLAEHADHVHLVCRGCGRVAECDPALAQSFVGNVLDTTGFVAEVTHMAVHGWCRECAAGR
jgi:Fur family ferric uptake transcriptional regulator